MLFLFGYRFRMYSASADGLGRESRGVQPLGLLGIFSGVATMQLEKSPNKLRYFPFTWKYPYLRQHGLVALCFRYVATLQWTDGLTDGWAD